MIRAIWLTLLLVLILSFWGVSTKAELQPTKDRTTDSLPLSKAKPVMASPTPQPAVAPTVTLRAASNATITFKTQNGETENGVPSQTMDVPHLVLFRNGTLTGSGERTLIVEVRDMVIPPTGVTVTLELQTQHGNPDLGGGAATRIPVWRESRRGGSRRC